MPAFLPSLAQRVCGNLADEPTPHQVLLRWHEDAVQASPR